MIEKIKIMSRSGKQRIGRRITVTTEFNALPDEVWGKILEFDTLSISLVRKPGLFPVTKVCSNGVRGEHITFGFSYIIFCQWVSMPFM